MKKTLNKWMTVLAASLGIAAAPIVFLSTLLSSFALIIRWKGNKMLGGAYFNFPALGAALLGFGWLLLVVVWWKRGNVGIRIGLTAVVWAFLAAVAVAFWSAVMTSAL